MSRNEKMKFIRLIEGSDLCIGDALAKYDVPRSTYYRWKRKLKSQGIKGLQDNKPYKARTWNQILPWQLDKILEYTTFNPEYSSREISLYITDNEGFSVKVCTKVGIGRKVGHKKRGFVQIFNKTVSEKRILDFSR